MPDIFELLYNLASEYWYIVATAAGMTGLGVGYILGRLNRDETVIG